MTREQQQTYFSVIGLLLVLIAIGVLCMSAVDYRISSKLNEVQVNFDREDGEGGFINRTHITRLIKNTFGDDLSHRVVEETDLTLIEEVMIDDVYISSANAYLNGANQLVIDIEERIPKYRVLHDGKDSYYIDGDNMKLPIHSRYVVRVPAVTIDRNHTDLGDEIRWQLLELVDAISADKFLSALIEQIHVDQYDKVFLMPKVGKEKIVFGKVNHISDKFYKLKQFYKKGITTKGWNKYGKIDLSYKDQVIGTIKE